LHFKCVRGIAPLRDVERAADDARCACRLDLLSTQLRFHMDVLQNKKSDALEWTIIVLICAEVALGVYDIVTRVH